ncbi:DUF2953 domain-containing protein [Alkaliphilus peptidifermentans]|uniref:DUF2953 domain-containing protein n=1 Tax=Alkaliphilus peptidifermentans DSM 18978 TaxID=1120976 RepID=A0A1G5KEU2_9FIRM|nr:DUF2953 domain-containing protein [Alkaliphilus peptidifermentans]SCY99123.1 Protein of unknown function [Alkaliphilus peptidifermentans DSM 18978]
MLIYVLLFFAFLFLVILIAFSNVSIRILFLKKNSRNEIVITLKLLFGLIKYRLEIPFVELMKSERYYSFIQLNSNIDIADKKVIKEPSDAALNFNELNLIYKKVMHLYEKYKIINKYIMEKLVIDQFMWVTEVGVEDAAITAIATGTLWMLKSNIFNLINRKVSLEDFNINVLPVYGIDKFETSLDCIIRLKIGYIIIAGIKMIKIILKDRGW